MSERQGYSAEDLKRLHQSLDALVEERHIASHEAARAYREASVQKNVANSRLISAKAKRGLVRKLLAELEQPGIYDTPAPDPDATA